MRCAEPDCQSDTTAVEQSARVRGSHARLNDLRGFLWGQVETVRFGSLADIGEGFQGYPLFPQKRTCSSSASMSAMCQKRTSIIKKRLTRDGHVSIAKQSNRASVTRRQTSPSGRPVLLTIASIITASNAVAGDN